ncbi:MAG: histidine phosphatase family protein [Anaerolineae bacterium]|nr:histidine phosphatase family protein [Anaerolineae bacterium]
MKTVYLMRHGKSRRGPQYETDHERPLAKRGKQDAARMGAYLAENDLLPDLILSSTAERAHDTALRLADAADYQGEIRTLDALYFTDDSVYLQLLWGLDDALAFVMFVGHNPLTESVIETLSGAYARMPTAAVARIDFDVDAWSDVEEGTGSLVWVLRPKGMTE